MPVNTTPTLFDRGLYAARRLRGAKQAADRFLLTETLDGLAERLGAVRRQFERGLDLSTRAENTERLGPFARHWTQLAPATIAGADLVADEEALPFADDSFDLVVSVLALQAVNDLPGALAQIRRALKPDGLFLAALFGGETLRELRSAFAAGETTVRGGLSPRVAPFAEVRALGGLLQRAGFALPVADSERTTVWYRKFNTLVDDLRALGETNVLVERERRPLRRDVLGAALARYPGTENGRFPATFDIVYLTGWSPHESQPKPLRPGSATVRLADALGALERGTGEPVRPKR